MFEAIEKNPGVKESEALARTLTTPKPKKQENENVQETEAKVEIKNESKREDEQPKVSEAFLANLEQDLKMIHDVGLKFSLHEGTGRTMVTIVNKDTDKIIREIPSKEVLNLAAKLGEMIGIIFDETV